MDILPLHKYQEKAIDWMSSRDYGYLAIDMGLGKTRITIEYIKSQKKRALVIAPLRVACNTWPQEIEKWARGTSYTVLHGPKKDELIKKQSDIYIINYEGVEWLSQYTKLFKNFILILDEATAIKSFRAKRTKTLLKMRPWFSKVFNLSALPSPNGYQDLWSQYKMLDDGQALGTRWTHFLNKYYNVYNFITTPKGPWIGQEIEQLIAPLTFRLDAEDYLPLPDFIYNDIYISLPDKLTKAYKDFEDEFVLALENETSINAMNAAALSNKLRQFVQGAVYSEEGTEDIHNLKLEALQEIAEELNSPALVVIQFKSDLAKIKTIWPDIPAIVGGQSKSLVDKYIREWNGGKIKLLVCHPASISHGVNLQHGGNNIIWYAQTWNYEHYEQFNGRLRRQGQTKPVVLTRLLMKNTIDERVAKALVKKGASQKSLLDALKAE